MPDPTENTFTPAAAALWQKVPPWVQTELLTNVWCSRCACATTIIDFRAEVVSGDLVLTGTCQTCSAIVRRLIESESDPPA